MVRQRGPQRLGELVVRAATTTVVLHGELDVVTINEMRDLLDEAVARAPRSLLIDLADVPFIDVLSLSAILAAADAVRDDGGVAAVTGASTAVRKICALLNAGDVLTAAFPLQRRAVS